MSLKPLFDSGEVFQVILEDEIPSIQISTNKHHFHVFETVENQINTSVKKNVLS